MCTAVRRLVVRLDPRDPQPRGVLRQRPAARSQRHPERFVQLHPFAGVRPPGVLRRGAGPGPGIGIRRERSFVRHRRLRLALQISHHYRSRARSVCPSRPDLHLRHLDYPRLGHPVRPRKRGQDQTGRPSGQGQRPEVHDVRHARIRHPRQIHLQRR